MIKLKSGRPKGKGNNVKKYKMTFKGDTIDYSTIKEMSEKTGISNATLFKILSTGYQPPSLEDEIKIITLKSFSNTIIEDA